MAPLNDAFNGSESIYSPKEFRSFDCKMLSMGSQMCLIHKIIS